MFMWQRSKKEVASDMLSVKQPPRFGNLFFSQSLHQKFNNHGLQFLSDENESAIVKYSRLLIANQDLHKFN